MRLYKILFTALLCMGAALLFQCGNKNLLTVPHNQAASDIIPLPEAEQKYSSSTPVDAIVVDKEGKMTETQYVYNPELGGVVVDNEEDLSANGASIFFPAFEVGLLWWGGYWVDHEGNYWDGNHYRNVNDPMWHDHWDHYWNNNWNNKWKNYRDAHRGNSRIQSPSQRDFNRHGGMNRPAHAHGGGGRR